MLHAVGVLARQEPLVAETVGRQARQRERVEHGGRPGRARDRQAAFDRPAHDREPGIVDRGHAGVGDDEHRGAGLHLVEQSIGLAALVVVVVRHHMAADAHTEPVGERV